MATKTLGACMACRARKVKCIPGTPRCARCTAIGIEDCKYGSVKKRGVGNTLRMGQACIPCRRKKTKCDAKLPCARCVSGGTAAECTYELKHQSRPAVVNTPSVSRDKTSSPLRVRDSPSQKSSDGFSVPSTNPLDRPQPAWSDSGESSSHSRSLSPSPPREQPSTVRLPWELSPRIHNELVPRPSSDVSVVRKPQDTVKRVPPPAVPSFAILPSILFQTIPRPLRIPLSLIPPEYMQISDVAGDDLGMTFRLRSLCRLNRLGLYLTKEKQEAILRGDLSDAVIDRYFVYGFQAVGMHFCGTPDGSLAMVLLQAKYAQAAWESLIRVFETNKERLKVQGLVLLVHAFIVMGWTISAQSYLLKLCKIIEEAGLQYLPTCGRPAELSEQVREDASVLSQAIYLENYFYLTLGGSAPVFTARIEREFRLDLQRVYPILFDMCPLTMEAQSILLVRDAILVLNSHSVDQEEGAASRQKSCHQLVVALDNFSNNLVKNLQWFIKLEDSSGVGTIWTCCITCLAHLIALCHLVSRTQPALGDSMDDLFVLALEKLGNLSLEVHIEEYSSFDVLTGLSWKRALDTIDKRIELRGSDGESGSLRHWRGVIGQTYDDFQAKFSEYSPPLLASLALSVDGRTEDSSFPNLVIPREREPYGF